MIKAVFISDIHLHPSNQVIQDRFNQFIEWVHKQSIESVYILGDFFHVWSGDDLMNEWSSQIALKIASLHHQNIKVYFIHGNRDFLLGEKFFNLANMVLLKDPSVIELGGQKVLITHGDQYCTKDKGHQLLRMLTRNRWFKPSFSCIPKLIRQKIVSGFRKQRVKAKKKPQEQLEIVVDDMLKDLDRHDCKTIIHGHIHKPGLTTHQKESAPYHQYVLCDWDDTPTYLCYYISKGFMFERGL